MPKVTKNSNYRVIVTPHVSSLTRSLHRTPGSLERDIKNKCHDLVDAIKRHVDGVDSIHIECDTEEICSHCGLSWSETEEGEPNCCAEAVKEYEESKTKVAG